MEIERSYDSNRQAPLGHLRLRLIELVNLMIKLNKQTVYDALQESDIFARINDLLTTYPWNNFLQLKVIAIYEEILENLENANFRKVVLEKSNIGPTLISLGKQPQYQHESKRYIRHGYMATVIKLGNYLQKH